MSDSTAQRGLLFAALAEQMDFVGRKQLLAAGRVWTGDKSQSIGEILVRQGALLPERRALLDALVEEHLRMHEGDPDASLAAVRTKGVICEELQRLDGQELEVTFTHTPETRKAGEPSSTVAWWGKTLPGGRFRVLRPQGRGGSGLVWVAQDEELHREVAFKELQEQHADNPRQRQRFVLEAEITGALEHPGIVPIYGLGRHDNGRPYYAMRFVRGESLRDSIARFHAANAAQPNRVGRTLELRKLLRHFLDMCNAVGFAHSRGVLHRDLKPSNIMLGRYGETLVLDWGLAKLVARPETAGDPEKVTLHPVAAQDLAETQLGKVVGTPAYMSPEQAEGRNDLLGPATDVYSLGATLYHLLAGDSPLHKSDSMSVLDKVRRGDFPPPSAIDPDVPRVLEAVCLKAMALNPKDRYATPGALAEDIEHWLADEPTTAHRDTPWERLGRWMRRHRSWVRAGAAALSLTAIIAVTAALLVNRARQEAADLADRNAALAEQERAARQVAVARLRAARQAVDTWLTGASEVLKNFPNMQAARQRLLTQAAADYESFAAQSSSDPELELERGRTYLRLGDVRRQAGNTREALAAYATARDLCRRLAEERPEDVETPMELANAEIHTGLLLADIGELPAATEQYRSAAAHLAAVQETAPQNVRCRELRGACLLNYGSLQHRVGDRAAAERLLREALDVYERLARETANDGRPAAGHQARAIAASNLLATIFVDDGRHEQALTMLQRTIAASAGWAVAAGGNPELVESRAATHLYLADVFRALGRDDEEMAAYRAATADYEALQRAMPDVPLYREGLALGWIDVGQLLHETGRDAEAEKVLRQAMPHFEWLVGRYPDVLGYVEGRAAASDVLGQILGDLGRRDDALKMLAAAVDGFHEVRELVPDSVAYRERYAVCCSHRAQLYHKSGDSARAEEDFHTAAGLLEDLGRNAPNEVSYRSGLAFVCEHRGRWSRSADKKAEAEADFRRARDIREGLVRDGAPPNEVYLLAWFYANCAEPALRDPARACELARTACDRNPQNAWYHLALAAGHYRSADCAAAETALREAQRLRSDAAAPFWFYAAMIEHRLGRAERAAESYGRGCQWLKDNSPDRQEWCALRDEAAGVLGMKPSK